MKEILEKYHQSHLLTFYKELNNQEKDQLEREISQIDFEQINKLYQNNNNQNKENQEITPIQSYKSLPEYEDLGKESVINGEYALITMAGGQGTRLGFSGPKGCFILPIVNKSLFEIQCDSLKKIYKKTNVYINWYIMTSKDNYQASVDFFIKNNYFDYPQDKIKFFVQDELPIVDLQGKILLDKKYSICMGPNGHGGIFSFLEREGILEELKIKQIKWIFIGGIDNVLLPVDQFDLIGFAIKNNFLAVSKTISKAYPQEKVGVFCKKNNRINVIEYFEMTEEMNNQVDEQGKLIYKDAHILCNLFNIEVLEQVKNKPLNYRAALKKVNHLDLDGNYQTPEKENAYKFESFLFDAFSYVDNVGLLEAKREEIFAPIKNKEGVDSPETALNLYLNYHKNKVD